METMIKLIKRIMEYSKELLESAKVFFKQMLAAVEKDLGEENSTPPPVIEPEKPVEEEPTKPIEPEIVKNIIARFEEGSEPKDIPANDDNSFVDDDGNEVPFTIRIPMLIREGDDGIFLSKSERGVGHEWMFRIQQERIEFLLQAMADRSSVKLYLPFENLPINEKFHLVITSTGGKRIDTDTIESGKIDFFVNVRRIENTGIGSGTYSGMSKTNAPITIGKSNWSDNVSTLEMGEVIIEKGRVWSVEEIIEDYKTLFNVTDLFLKPSEDGKVHIPVTPNTGQEVGLELAETFRKVANGSDVVLPNTGNYLVDLDLNSPNRQSAIEFYGKHDISLAGNASRLYDTRLGIDDSGVRNNSNRLKVNVMDCRDISIKDLNVESVFDVTGGYKSKFELEHAFSNTHSENLYYENIKVKDVGGDGLYFKYCKNVHVKNILTDGTNRMGIGISHGSHNIKIENYEAKNCVRASIDLEGDSPDGVIDDIEITDCYLPTYLAAAGNSRINNVNIHHNRWIKDIIMKGNMWVTNPNYNRSIPESLENPREIDAEPRENWDISDNNEIGRGGTPMAMIRLRYCKNVKINRNKNIWVVTSQGRSGIALDYCSGRIEIMNNGYEHPCINRILRCEAGTEVIIDEPNNQNIYAVQIEGKPLRLIGTDVVLLAMMFTRSVEFLSNLLLGETEIIKEAFIAYPKLFQDVEIPDWDHTQDVSTAAEIASKDEHILYYFFVVEYEAMRFILNKYTHLLDKFDRV